MKSLLFMVLIVMSSSAFGGWSSGGAELLKDGRNPWFLDNTKDISYCISIDEKNFGVDKAVAAKKITEAIDFWKEEFKSAILSPHTKVATQNFHEVECTENVDVRFQFGTLSEMQKLYLKNPSEYAAVSVRTDYSEKTLKGKGFIYISSEQGPLAYNPKGVITKGWSRNGSVRLYLTLLHELGHVFGLSHSGSVGDLMSEGFVEISLSQANQDFLKNPVPKSFFTLRSETSRVCPADVLLQVWKPFFELKDEEKCLQLELGHDSKNQLFGSSLLKVVASTEMHSRVVAEIKVSTQRFFPYLTSFIWLTDKQEIFSKDSLLKVDVPMVVGPSLFTVTKRGSFLTESGKKRTLSVRFEQGKTTLSVDGVTEDGELVTIF